MIEDSDLLFFYLSIYSARKNFGALLVLIKLFAVATSRDIAVQCVLWMSSDVAELGHR